MVKARIIESFGIYESRFSSLGFVLLVIGVYYLGKNMGWWPEVQFWPLFLIIVGLYMVIKKLSSRWI